MACVVEACLVRLADGYHGAVPPASHLPTGRPEPDRLDDTMVAVFAPALLLTVEIHAAADGCDEIHLHPGGQGYWISKMVQALGGTPLPCVVAGGEAGHALASLIAADGLDAWLVEMTHGNAVHIDDRRSATVERLGETRIPSLDRHEVDELYSAIVGASMRAGVCVLAGTQLAPMFDNDTFRRLVTDLRKNDVTVVADLSGEPLQAALTSGVDIVKVSHEELIAGGWADGDSVAAVVRGIEAVMRAGATTVVVSRQDRTTIAGHGDEFVEVRSPSLEVLDGRGGGDSMTAALAVGAAQGLAFVETLRLAAAAGALNVSRHGLGTGRRDAIEQIAQRVEVKPVKRPASATIGDGTTVAELRKIAARLEIAGRSTMDRAQLVAAIRRSGP
jgi:1-phosphofructokinase